MNFSFSASVQVTEIYIFFGFSTVPIFTGMVSSIFLFGFSGVKEFFEASED
jgi:hypothetical protein